MERGGFMLRFRLKTGIWIEALRRRVEAGGAFFMVLQKGDPDGGSVVILVESRESGAALYTAQTQMDGTRAWHVQTGISPLELKKRVSQLQRMDEDMWCIEVTDQKGRHFINEPILTD